MYLANQLYPEYIISLYNTYLDATRGHHGYLILNLTQYTNDGLSNTTNVFSAKYPPIVYCDIGDEACEIALPYPPRDQDGRNLIA